MTGITVEFDFKDFKNLSNNKIHQLLLEAMMRLFPNILLQGIRSPLPSAEEEITIIIFYIQRCLDWEIQVSSPTMDQLQIFSSIRGD